MSNFELFSFATADELAHTVASKWLDQIEAAGRAGQPHCVALSGGRITQKFFAAVVEQAKVRKIGDGSTPSFPSNAHFFWADERCVPPDDPESNFRLANELLFTPLKIPERQIHRIRGELPPETAAEIASQDIRRVVSIYEGERDRPGRSSARPRAEHFAQEEKPMTRTASAAPETGVLPILDLIFLGMGEDGHVASLFPAEMEAAIADQAIYRVVKNSPKPPPNRVTLGYDAIAAARQVWVLVSGAGKEEALRESLHSGGRTPLGRVTQFRTRKTLVFSDFRLA